MMLMIMKIFMIVGDHEDGVDDEVIVTMPMVMTILMMHLNTTIQHLLMILYILLGT